MSILIRDAYVLTMDKQDNEHSRADILIEGSKIAAIGPDLDVSSGPPDLRIIEAGRLLAMPGLINGHLHSPGNFLKGAVDDLPLGACAVEKLTTIYSCIRSFFTTTYGVRRCPKAFCDASS